MNDHDALLAYWPGRERIDECLRTEAETADQALLLAVHEPVTLLRRPEQSGAAVIQASEMELLHTLMRPADDGSAVLVAITGASGVGKSHMVRWLQAQLERHPRRQDLVIVTIPKTASLRRVVELILEPLANAEYEALQQELAHAAEVMNPVLAAELLATTLADALESFGKVLEEDIRARRLGTEFGPRIRLAQHLRALLRDPDVRDAWLHDVLRRIVGASLRGTADPADRQFQPQDLEPPPESAAIPLKKAVNDALAFLANANGRYRATAAEILQELLDPALRTIFRFTDALHQRSLEDLVNDIREQLLRDGKELVLLIEDLAALSGIQEPLLKIVIAESDHQGVRVRAPIRTVLAVTDGFLAGRKTVLTRAREEWVVPSEGLDESIIQQRLVSLTGRYLNAARWGVASLRQAFKASAQDSVDLYGWVPCFNEALDAAAADQLDAFGRNAGGHSLFPFNEAAIRSLAAAALKAGDTWTFRPRTFINEVLRKTLLERPLFEEGRFPPAGFHQARLTAELDQELQFRGYASDETGRLRTALFHWASHPRSLTVAPLHGECARYEGSCRPIPYRRQPAQLQRTRSATVRIDLRSRQNG
ncbi:MAG: ATP-binding protein [Burkholderiales bacterium]|nr:ATP-binding protein [Roseateles sp.]MBV8658496.1 ATP-binding protein [Burkholderiales bacterium]